MVTFERTTNGARRFRVIDATVVRLALSVSPGGVMMAARRWYGRRFSDAERMPAFQRILEGASVVDIAVELDCSSTLPP